MRKLFLQNHCNSIKLKSCEAHTLFAVVNIAEAVEKRISSDHLKY